MRGFYVVGDDPDEPFSDNEDSDSEHDGSPAKFVHKLAKIPIPQRTARPARSTAVSSQIHIECG